jgi:hypothetical protein
MRGANAYQSLSESHARLNAEPDLPGLRYEDLRTTQRELDEQALQQPDGPTRPETVNYAARPATEGQVNADRTPGQSPENAPSGTADHYLAPEQWTNNAGMVEQQDAARDWIKHNHYEQGRYGGPNQGGAELSQEDLEILKAARATEAQTMQQQQELSRSQVYEPSGP